MKSRRRNVGQNSSILYHGLRGLPLLWVIVCCCQTDGRGSTTISYEHTSFLGKNDDPYQVSFKCGEGDFVEVRSNLPLKPGAEEERTDSLVISIRNGEYCWSRSVLEMGDFNLGESEKFYNHADFYSVDVTQGDDCSLDVFVAMGVPETDWSYAFILRYMRTAEKIEVFELTNEGETIVRKDIILARARVPH